MEETLLEMTPLVIMVEVVPVLDEVGLMVPAVGDMEFMLEVALIEVFKLEIILDDDIPVVLTVDEDDSDGDALML